MSDGREIRFRNLDGQHVDWSDLDDRPRLRVVPPPEPSESTSAPIEAPEAVLPPSSGPLGLGPVPPGKDASEGVWVGGVWQERPQEPDGDPVRGLRAYLAVIKAILDPEEHQP
jgi:hypothetical protein